MLLDCDAATLTVWVNGERKGFMVRPGQKFRSLARVNRLDGPLRWVVGLAGAASVAIASPLPAPAVAAEDLAEVERQQRELDAAASTTSDDE